jgi:hypothetical protein
MKCSEYTVRLFGGAMTLSIKKFSIMTQMTLGKKGLFVTFSINDTQLTTLCHYTECHFIHCHAECHNAECYYSGWRCAVCHGAFYVVINNCKLVRFSRLTTTSPVQYF